MIYQDTYSCGDSEECPAKRYYEKCINCNGSWGEHEGWMCENYWVEKGYNIKQHDHLTFFNNCPLAHRYLTQTMVDSMPNNFDNLNQNAVSTTTLDSRMDISCWKAWAHNRPGDCPCGINRNDCSYHQG